MSDKKMPTFDYGDGVGAAVLPAQSMERESPLFEVTMSVVIGAVYPGGMCSPRVAAFMLIGEEDHDGEFAFPNTDGTTTHVIVESRQS